VSVGYGNVAGNTDDDNHTPFVATYCFYGQIPVYATIQYKRSNPSSVRLLRSVCCHVFPERLSKHGSFEEIDGRLLVLTSGCVAR
jgi:hypothetical protein